MRLINGDKLIRKLSQFKKQMSSDWIGIGFEDSEVCEAIDECIRIAEEMPIAEGAQKSQKKLDHGKICALYKAGWSLKQIAEDVKCTPQAVNKHLKKEGLKR